MVLMKTATPLFDPPVRSDPDPRRFINRKLWFEDRDGYRVIFYDHAPIYSIAANDAVHSKSVAVFLRLGGYATQREIAEAFGHSVATQRRWENTFQKDGWDGFDPKVGPG